MPNSERKKKKNPNNAYLLLSDATQIVLDENDGLEGHALALLPQRPLGLGAVQLHQILVLLAVPVAHEADLPLPLAQLVADDLGRIIENEALGEAVRLRAILDAPLHDLFDLALDLDDLDWDEASVCQQLHLLLGDRKAVQYIASQLTLYIENAFWFVTEFY